jgi:hypothetical protein
MVNVNVTSPKKSSNEQIKNQMNAHSFFDSCGIVHKEFVPPGQTVNQAFYQEVLGRLRQRVMRVCRDIASSWILHHDNAPSHTSLAVREFWLKNKSQFFHILPTALTWHPVIFSCSRR